MHASLLAVIAMVLFVVVAVMTHAVVPWLRTQRMLDVPNERSSHDLPTPRGGGIAPVTAIIVGGVAASVVWELPQLQLLLAATAFVAALSLLDDLSSLQPLPRLVLQAVVVAASVLLIVSTWPPIFREIAAPVIVLPLLGLGWLWFINLFNFMDGIDGIVGTELIGIGTGAFCVLSIGGVLTGRDINEPEMSMLLLCVMLVASAAGFLTANWHPAKVFLGDVGSIPLGFLTGALLIGLASLGHVAAALILPSYFVLDASLTLAKRAIRGENLAVAHRSHAYQRAVQKGLSHADVCLRLMVLNTLLVMLAIASMSWPWLCLGLGYGLAFALYHYLLHLERWRSS
jgi:UDP-N-acetylmuramyl pentapeptide phosphotransferase/UDP-N-acetylglucosamine-1-phosphate transferase